MKKKLFAIGDVHGKAKMLETLLGAIHQVRQPGDVLCFLGDYIDRGEDSRGVIDQVLFEALYSPNDTCALWGNHEDMAAAALGMHSPCNMHPDMAGRTWMSNGGKQTIESYKDHGNEHGFASHFEQLHPRLNIYCKPYEMGQDVVCVHAGVPGGEDAEALATMVPDNSRATITGPAALLWMRPQPSDRKDPARLVVCGHTPRINEVVNEKYFICIDTGAAYGGCLTALELGADGSRTFWHVSPELRITKRDGTLGGKS